MINWAQFTPLSALLGGAIIGLAASIFLLFNGRIAGISGIVGGLFKPSKNDIGWRLAFVIGLLLAPTIYGLCFVLPSIQIERGSLGLIIAGLLVGIGTRYGSGCTSGHGVCGISRLSPRSMVATVAFMLAGIITVFIIRHLLNW